jgi:Branched-chain amino acid aminotransferase/4-amino-4-deoxychorismate lyase
VGETVFLNGEFVPLSAAKVSVLDRGFMLGDGVYEIMPAYSRVLFRLKEHLARLRYSLGSVRISDPYDTTRWIDLLETVVDRNPWPDQTVYLQVSRGVAPRNQPFPSPAVAPTVLIMSSELCGPTDEERNAGFKVITREDYRWLRCDIKTTSLIANCLLRQEAAEANCAEVILLRGGKVTEASSSNVFIVKNDVIIAPPKDNLILPGITYDLVLELAKADGLPFEVREISVAELYAADEVWLSSSIREVVPVTMVDGMPVGEGVPGPVYGKVYGLYQDYKGRIGHG